MNLHVNLLLLFQATVRRLCRAVVGLHGLLSWFCAFCLDWKLVFTSVEGSLCILIQYNSKRPAQRQPRRQDLISFFILKATKSQKHQCFMSRHYCSSMIATFIACLDNQRITWQPDTENLLYLFKHEKLERMRFKGRPTWYAVNAVWRKLIIYWNFLTSLRWWGGNCNWL